MPEPTPDDPPQARINAEREALLAECDKLHRLLYGWQFRVGPLRLRGYFSSGGFAACFVGFHLVVGLIGGGLIFIGGPPRDLGMAMVVGALFGFGAFLTQVWTVQMEKEHSLDQEGNRYRELVDRLRALDADAEK